MEFDGDAFDAIIERREFKFSEVNGVFDKSD